LLCKVLNVNFVRHFYQLKNNDGYLLCTVFNILTAIILFKNLFNIFLLKANQIKNEQTLQWLRSCFLIGGSRVQLSYVPFFKTWFKLKAKKKEKKEPVRSITRPSHRFLQSLTGSRRANCIADPKVCSNRSTHRFSVRPAGSSRVSKLC